ncbi:hypothetical protein CERSUDRAFT_75759 [Gelatoporia subvermispora B]|uniref:Uncharacterized protein n=1 Tax=Ceriporiopsis subvermispora (strain B) TaxID=914234 RepID=M2QCV9_CERS8|nr:hypothetical protein CERSUDRAFT_75759 [Gelatoporia subvermispora B]
MSPGSPRRYDVVFDDDEVPEDFLEQSYNHSAAIREHLDFMRSTCIHGISHLCNLPLPHPSFSLESGASEPKDKYPTVVYASIRNGGDAIEFDLQKVMIDTFSTDVLRGKEVEVLTKHEGIFHPRFLAHSGILDVQYLTERLPLAIIVHNDMKHEGDCRAHRNTRNYIAYHLQPTLFRLFDSSPTADPSIVLDKRYLVYGVSYDQENFTIYACYPDVKVTDGKCTWYIRIQHIRHYIIPASISHYTRLAIMVAMLLIEKQCSVLRVPLCLGSTFDQFALFEKPQNLNACPREEVRDLSEHSGKLSQNRLTKIKDVRYSDSLHQKVVELASVYQGYMK